MTADRKRPASSGRATAADVAAAAGVSKTAVSFAFNRPDRISESTRDEILAAADDLGYQPSTLGRMLSNGTTSALGLLLPQPIPEVSENPYYAQFLIGVGQVCDAEGMTLLLVPPLRNSMLQAIPYAAVDGFIVSGLEIDRGEVADLRRRKMPFVLVDSEAPEDVPSVDVNDSSGAEAAIHHLLDLGHHRLAILAFEAGPRRQSSGYRGPLGRRIDGIQQALATVGRSLSDDHITLLEAPAHRTGGYKATRSLLARDDRPTAIFALSDILALGALHAAQEAGLNVPRDLSIVGYDDQPDASWTRPTLTTVRQPIVSKGRLAADFLVAAIHGQATHPHQVLQTSLITRESTAPPTAS